MSRKEYEELKRVIDYHMDRYYNLDDPANTTPSCVS